MDFPNHDPNVDYYQIYRTPYFKRLHRNNTLGQIQRLKEAYESIRSFDEKPLQNQIKKVRIDKLKNRIKNSMAVVTKPIKKPKNKRELRLEALEKARQLGILYSRQNNQGQGNIKAIEAKSSFLHQDLQMRKSRLHRRLNYGNQQAKLYRYKNKRLQSSYLPNSREFYTLTRKTSLENKERIRDSILHYLFEDNPDPGVINLFEEIVQTKNHLYWDFMGTVAKFNKKLKKLGLKDFDCKIYHEVFSSKSNIKACGSEVLLKTYRYSDDNEFLPAPTESFLRIPSSSKYDATDDIPTRDGIISSTNEMDSIDHLHITIPISQMDLSNRSSEYSSKREYDLSQKFGVNTQPLHSKCSTMVLTSLQKAIKH